MRSSIPFKKLITTPKNIGQSSDKKSTSTKLKQERINSMFQLLKINGKEVFDEPSHKKTISVKQKLEIQSEQFIEKQFQGLKARIKSFFQNQQAKFTQHSKMQKLVNEQKFLHENKITEEDLFTKLFQRIRKFFKEKNLVNIERINIKNLEFMPIYEGSYNNSCNNDVNGTAEETEQRDKIQKNETNQYNIMNPKAQFNMKFTGDKFHPSNSANHLPISCSSTVSQILYKEAQNKEFQKFHDLCQKILLQVKPVISDINILKNQQLEKTNSYLNQIYKKLHLLNTQLSKLNSSGQVNTLKKQINFHEIKRKNIGEEIDHICGILKKINQIHNVESMFLSCQNPCCQFERQPNCLQTKAKILINMKKSVKKSIHYKTQVTDNYFNHFYNNDKFNISRVYSLKKTKTQEMQKMQKTHSRDKSKHFIKKNHSLYENFDC